MLVLVLVLLAWGLAGRNAANGIGSRLAVGWAAGGGAGGGVLQALLVAVAATTMLQHVGLCAGGGCLCIKPQSPLVPDGRPLLLSASSGVGPTTAKGVCLSNMPLRVLFRLVLFVLIVFLLLICFRESSRQASPTERPAPTLPPTAIGAHVDPTGASKFVHTHQGRKGIDRRSLPNGVILGLDDSTRDGSGTSLRRRPRV